MVLTSERNSTLIRYWYTCVFRICDIKEFKLNLKLYYEDKRNLKTRSLHKLGKYVTFKENDQLEP